MISPSQQASSYFQLAHCPVYSSQEEDRANAETGVIVQVPQGVIATVSFDPCTLFQIIGIEEAPREK